MKIENIKKKIKKYEEEVLNQSLNQSLNEIIKNGEDEILNKNSDKNNNFISIFNMPNTILATDFTHLYWKGYEFYLATVIDNYTKEIVGCDIGFHHDQDFIIGTTKKSINKTFKLFGFLPNWLHSDQGSEYRGFKHLKLLEENGIIPSMSKKSSPWENGLQEGFYGKLKLEIGDLNRFNSLEEAIAEVYSYIYYYNNLRIHTSIKMTPVKFRKQEIEKIKNDKDYFVKKENNIKKMQEENII